ncbi:MAG: RNA-binding S4 domain-containing protein [Acidobacteriota bacterium]|nr:RNA-binding S4 domain-containing protein [Acidobacteriota bacterium]
MRIDKWLWAARFFKTRGMASRACELGRIECGGHAVKPSREVRAGEMLRVRNDSGDFEIEVLALSAFRGPAASAQNLYRETEASKEARARAAAERKALMEMEVLPPVRPSKRDRRLIGRFRGR